MSKNAWALLGTFASSPEISETILDSGPWMKLADWSYLTASSLASTPICWRGAMSSLANGSPVYENLTRL